MTDSVEANVDVYSRPSDLKITDMRVVNLRGAPFRSTIIRLDTNQGICGYGEVRDGGSETYALMLKSRLIGENPCNIDKIFRKIKQFGHHARQAGGVCGIEMALMDLAGKAYGVPAYQLAGGKFRDRILCYCDTPSERKGSDMGKRLKERIENGFGFLKMDVGIGLLRDTEDTLIAPPECCTNEIMHPFTGIQITDKGINLPAVLRGNDEEIDMVPLAVDHFGHIGVESCIRLARRLTNFRGSTGGPWQFADQWQRLAESVDPRLHGEDIYLKEDFMPLFERRAIAVASRFGIIWRYSRNQESGDLAQDHGIAMALHMAMSPIAALALSTARRRLKTLWSAKSLCRSCDQWVA